MTEYADQLNDLTLTNTDQLIAPTIDFKLTVLLTERRSESWLTDCLKDWETERRLTDRLSRLMDMGTYEMTENWLADWQTDLQTYKMKQTGKIRQK